MTFVEVVHGLTQLGTFDRGSCDAVLNARAIDVTNAFKPTSGHGEDDVYVGLVIVLVWLTGVAALNVLYFRGRLPMGNSDPKRYGRFILPILLIIGTLGLCAQLSGMANYAETCRRLLHV